MGQFVQIVGSLLVLSAFAAAQQDRVNHRSKVYLLLNIVGSSVLAIEAVVEEQWGFLLLEGVWAVVSMAGLVAVIRGTTAGRR